MAGRLRGGAAELRGTTVQRPSLSPWAWLADVILALALATATAAAARKYRGDGLVIVPGRLIPPDRLAPLLPPDAPLLPPDPPAPPAAPGGDYSVVTLVTHDGGHVWWLVLAAALTAAPLVVRRRYPLAAFGATIGSVLLFRLYAGDQMAGEFLFASCVIAGYSAARYSPYRAGALAAVAVCATLIAPLEFRGFLEIRSIYFPLLVLVPIGIAANTIHTWRQRLVALEAEQEATTRLAVERERSRIARELHDVVTHNVSVMVVQAGAARKVLEAAPGEAREALLAVEAGGRAAMAELRHVMGLLTMAGDGPDPAGTADLAPQPGLDQVAALASRVRDTGVPVELTVTGAPVPLPVGVDLAAYRVVQEALTNTVKHAAGAHVAITIAYAADALRVEVTDTGGVATAPAGTGSGRGLIGLRERLAVYGGTLRAGKRPTGGYRVRAVIPVEEG
ncbi:sensor histidine kinase [Pseudofrankia sp. BMG5.37]|uniref:sensor histidine kinase n=1 Tax=Pseudofrankia sp. BMG5.37 TaxID=3050035 RepID=UPI0008DB06AB|nr:two-component sensor histidine kinase [Pseudofrankia sp. BMG5.36]